jgi:hypothetical protein
MKVIIQLIIITTTIIGMAGYSIAGEMEKKDTTSASQRQELIAGLAEKIQAPMAQVFNTKRQVRIIDEKGNTIREGCMDETEGFCPTSTLVPIIYRSVYLTDIHGISYYMLNKGLEIQKN